MRRIDAELAALEQAMEVATRQRGRALALAQLIESAAAARSAAAGRRRRALGGYRRAGALRRDRGRRRQLPDPVRHDDAPRRRSDQRQLGAHARAAARSRRSTLHRSPTTRRRSLPRTTPNCRRRRSTPAFERAEGYPLFLDQLLRAASAGHDTAAGIGALARARARRSIVGPRSRGAAGRGAILGHRFSTDGAASHARDDPSTMPGALSRNRHCCAPWRRPAIRARAVPRRDLRIDAEVAAARAASHGRGMVTRAAIRHCTRITWRPPTMMEPLRHTSKPHAPSRLRCGSNARSAW